MKNLFKSVSGKNSSKFIFNEMMGDSTESTNAFNSKLSDNFDVGEYGKKRKERMDSAKDLTKEGDPIFEEFDFECESLDEETISALKEHGFAFNGPFISLDGRKLFKLDSDTKSLFIESSDKDIITIIIRNKTAPDNIDVFNFKTGKVTVDGKIEKSITLPISEQKEDIVGSQKLSKNISIKGKDGWLNNEDIPIVPSIRIPLAQANKEGYYIQNVKEGAKFIIKAPMAYVYSPKGKMIGEVAGYTHNEDWLQDVINVLEEDMK